MNKGTWIAVGIALVLGAVYLATSQGPRETSRTPYTVEKVDELNRIELRPPAGNDAQSANGSADAGNANQGATDRADEEAVSLIAFQKRKEGWWLSQPVEAPVSETIDKKFDELFGAPIETDDLQIPTESPGQYKLDDANAVKLSLFADGESAASVELNVGKQMEVEQTNAKRTFIQPSGSDEIYRAQAALGELVRKSVDDFRSDKILSVERKAVSKLTVKRADGMYIEIIEEMPEGGGDKQTMPSLRGTWKLKEPSVDWEVDQQEIRSTVGVLTELTATGFADDLTEAEAGLDEPEAKVTVTEGDQTHTLLIGVVEPTGTQKSEGETGKLTYYAKRPGERFIYKIGEYPGDKLEMTLGEIRSKTPRSIPPTNVTRLAFAGEDNVVVSRDDEGDWMLERPTAEKEFNAKKLKAYSQNLLSLTVSGFPNVEPGEVGLERGADEVLIERKNDTPVRLLIGERTEDGGRYVRFDDDPEVFSISSATHDKLTVQVEDVVGEIEKPKRGRGMPKGMGGGPGAKGGLSPGQKQKLMQQLKQKMGGR